jgi:2'-hydroxyisoflavone reductase
MRILILGGTVFVGKAITDAALAAGHDVTQLNRGKSSTPDPRVSTILGDRGDEATLAKARGPWDAVIDTSGYLPQVVRKSARALRDLTGRYCFVSSISAYAGDSFAEDGPLAPALDHEPEAMTMERYGALKGMCEAAVRAELGEDALIVRPGLIVGPNDPTDRFTYWPVRVARGGRVAAPGRASRTVQFIDARDLARWMVALVERGPAGTYNATGPAAPIAMEKILHACREVSASDAAFDWIDEEFLHANNIAPWKDMPLWIPETDPHAAAFMAIPIQRARATGLVFRPLEETIADTLAWERTRPADRTWKAGLDPSREAGLLDAWRCRPSRAAG